MPGRALGLAAALAVVLAAPAAAQDSAQAPDPAGPNEAPLPFPVEIEAAFSLIDQDGHPVEAADFAGRPFLLFFGYSNCESICSVALPAMAEAVDLVPAAGVLPVVVTVDPARDTPAAMRRALAPIHPDFVGLTGSPDALAAVRDAFQVQISQVAEGPGGSIYAHGSFIYLVGPDGRVRTLMPPVLPAVRIAELIRRHL